MCAEAVPWCCHRSLVSGVLLIRGILMCEIIEKYAIRQHILTSFAEVKQETITYPKIDTEELG
jgi:uncharacterized protein (DUF488 family)